MFVILRFVAFLRVLNIVIITFKVQACFLTSLSHLGLFDTFNMFKTFKTYKTFNAFETFDIFDLFDTFWAAAPIGDKFL